MFGVNANIPPTPSPLFQPASNRLVLQSMQINETRSSHQDSDSDSDKVGFAVALGSQAPAVLTKDLGDVNNATFPIGSSIGPLVISDPHIGLAMNYAVVNSGNPSWNDVSASLTRTVGPMCSLGAKAATSSLAAVAGVVNGFTLPLLGSILGPISSLLISTLGSILNADRGGPVAAEQLAFNGIRPIGQYRPRPPTAGPPRTQALTRTGATRHLLLPGLLDDHSLIIGQPARSGPVRVLVVVGGASSWIELFLTGVSGDQTRTSRPD